MATPNLGLPFIEASQAQKHVTHNEALLVLDGLVQLAVLGRTLLNPPASPAEGDVWIVPASGATGDWATHGNAVAIWRNGLWNFYPPNEGWIAHVADEGSVVFAAGAWQPHLVVTTHGAAIGLEILEEEMICTGASVSTAIRIPARSIVLAVSVRTTVAITGATAFDCGIAGDQAKFGGSLGIGVGATNIGVIGPTAFYADTAVVLTALGSAFTGGQVRVAVQILTFAAPSS